jgi:hypothetical protein
VGVRHESHDSQCPISCRRESLGATPVLFRNGSAFVSAGVFWCTASLCPLVNALFTLTISRTGFPDPVAPIVVPVKGTRIKGSRSSGRILVICRSGENSVWLEVDLPWKLRINARDFVTCGLQAR